MNYQRRFQLGIFTLSLLSMICVYRQALVLQSAQIVPMEIDLSSRDESTPQSLETIWTKSDKWSGNILPQTVVDRVKTFVFFLGNAQSGHSIVASLMDSHPHVVISHQLELFDKLSSNGLHSPIKSAVFNAVWEDSRQAINASGMKNSMRTYSNKRHTLLVDGLYQGRYLDYIDVIGDKKVESTAEMFYTKPDNWSTVFNILKSLGVTLKVIHVIRNPYDNIAKMLLLSPPEVHRLFTIVKKTNKTYKQFTVRNDDKIQQYFLNHQAVVDVKKRYDLDVIEIHGKDLISNPRSTLMKMCNELGVTCSDKYLDICSNKIFKSESRTRDKIKWTDRQLKRIQQNIKKYDCLKGYSFDSL